ncbi:uncharacterized protein [Mytilus edulis]
MMIHPIKESLLLIHNIIVCSISATHWFRSYLMMTTKYKMLFVILLFTTYQLTVTAQHNLTPYGTATQSSNFEESLPQNAIEPPISNTFSKTLCSHTDRGSKPAWWMFHFSFGPAYITDINIYYRENFAVRMDGFKVYVTNTSTIPPNGHLCHKDGPGLPITTQTIPCNQLGQYVIYYDTKGSVQDGVSFGPIIELCYVAINGCPKGTWGRKCTTKCPSKCINQHCHLKNGSCVWGS